MLGTNLIFENSGPLLVSSNYWESDLARAGYPYLSINAGAFRLLVPKAQRSIVSDMCSGAKYVVVSMLARERWRKRAVCCEWLVEDSSSTPWSWHLSSGQVDRLPWPDQVGKQWLATVWDLKKGRPHKCLEKPAYFQIVPSLLWLRNVVD